ncbi:MAG TPA: RagB/SusD family nutrient uptake outer membrane protein [Puia sp.]|nr:RagB/SusD family nutrient uptake outer membrane protein [Puia sp.]
MIRYKKLFIGLVSISLLAGCSKNLLNEDSRAQGTANLLFTSKDGFQNAVNGLYDEARRYRSGNLYKSINDIMCMQAMIGTDNAYGNWRDPTIDVFNLWAVINNPSFGHYNDVWGWLYETINAANTIVNRAAEAKIEWTDAEKDNIVAQARLIRAWCYRHLTYLWGDVPLNLEESTGSNIKTDWQRTPVAQVRDVMRDDLLFAEQHLPVTAASDAQLIQGIASHYLAELYLSMGKADSAKIEALKVTTNPSYALMTSRFGVNAANPGTPFTDLFLDGNSMRSEGNTETLWGIQNDLTITGGEGYNIMRRYWANRYYSLKVTGTDGKATSPVQVVAAAGGRGIGRMSPTRWMMNLFKGVSDDRGSSYAWHYYYLMNTTPPKGYAIGDTVWLDSTGVEKLSNPNWPSTSKWDWSSTTNVLIDPQYNDQVFLRSAETYLLLAEADFDLNDLQGAADAINALRARAHAAPVDAGDITIDFILDERARELFSEEDRRYVLLRTHRWLDRVKLYNKIAAPNVAARDTLLPIPQPVIDANRTSPMTQNPGY